MRSAMSTIDLASLFFRQIREAEERADRMYEAVVGIVVDNKDPQKLSRVKVRFPSLPGEDTSAWAPLAALGAGKQRGWYFLPELDDEVVVMFEHGDIRRPVVLGALWNGQDDPPEQNGGSNDRRVIVSREGSKIVFDDDAGTITLESGPGKVVIDTSNKITIEAGGGADACFQAPDGDLAIVANEVKIEGSMNCDIKATSDITMGGSGVTIKAGMMLQVHGSKTQLNPGGGSDPDEADASPEDVPDPIDG
jgi:phage baseplate assembly protein V